MALEGCGRCPDWGPWSRLQHVRMANHQQRGANSPDAAAARLHKGWQAGPWSLCGGAAQFVRRGRSSRVDWSGFELIIGCAAATCADGKEFAAILGKCALHSTGEAALGTVRQLRSRSALSSSGEPMVSPSKRSRSGVAGPARGFAGPLGLLCSRREVGGRPRGRGDLGIVGLGDVDTEARVQG